MGAHLLEKVGALLLYIHHSAEKEAYLYGILAERLYQNEERLYQNAEKYNNLCCIFADDNFMLNY